MKNKIFKILSLLLVLTICFSLSACKKEPEVILPEKVGNQEKTTYVDYEKAKYYHLSSLSIPYGWEKEERDNGFSVIERKTGTEIYFEIDDYNPFLNNITHDMAKESLTTQTRNFISYQKTAGNKLSYKYSDIINTKKYIILENVLFSYKYTYILRLYCEEPYLSKFEEVFNNVASTMILSNDFKTIPTNYNGIYFEKFKVLCTYPRDWKTTSNIDSLTTSYANTSITITNAAPIPNFKGLDKTTYNATMQKTVSNFSTSNFALNGYTMDAEGYYTENSVRYIVYNRIYNLPTLSINIIYVSPENEAASYSNHYATMINNIFEQ